MQSRSSCDILLAARHRAMWLSFIRSVSSNSNANNRRPKQIRYELPQQQNVLIHTFLIHDFFFRIKSHSVRSRLHDIDIHRPLNHHRPLRIVLQSYYNLLSYWLPHLYDKHTYKKRALTLFKVKVALINIVFRLGQADGGLELGARPAEEGVGDVDALHVRVDHGLALLVEGQPQHRDGQALPATHCFLVSLVVFVLRICSLIM